MNTSFTGTRATLSLQGFASQNLLLLGTGENDKKPYSPLSRQPFDEAIEHGFWQGSTTAPIRFTTSRRDALDATSRDGGSRETSIPNRLNGRYTRQPIARVTVLLLAFNEAVKLQTRQQISITRLQLFQPSMGIEAIASIPTHTWDNQQNLGAISAQGRNPLQSSNDKGGVAA